MFLTDCLNIKNINNGTYHHPRSSTKEDVLIENSFISHSIFIVQCMLGILLNIGKLVVFFFMKQVSYNNIVNLSSYCFLFFREKFRLWF